MYVLKTKFGSYVTGRSAVDVGMIENSSDNVDDALAWGTVTELVGFLRSLPAIPLDQQNRLSIHRVEPPKQPSPVDMGPV